MDAQLRAASGSTPPKTSRPSSRYPSSTVNINELALHGAQAGLFTYNARTEGPQAIKVSRNPAITSTSVTWRAPATLGTVGSDYIYVAMRDVLRE